MRHLLPCLLLAALLPACQSKPEKKTSSPQWQPRQVHPHAQKNPWPATFFGMHFHKRANVPSQAAFPLRTVRLWDAGVAWQQLQPRPDSFNFQALDRWVRLAEKRNWQLVYVFGRTPRWASARPGEYSVYGPGQAAEPAELQYWNRFVDTLAQRYKGQIRYWEIWNEPNYQDQDSIWFYTGDIATMARMTQAAYRILKTTDSANQVLSPAAVAGDFDFTRQPGYQWFPRFLRQGGRGHFDILATHYYLKKGRNQPEKALPLMARMDSMRKAENLSKLPIWNTETGFLKPDQQAYPDRQAIATMGRSHLLAWLAGTQRYYWYSYDNRGFVTLFFAEEDRRTPTPAAQAYIRLKAWCAGWQVKAYSGLQDGSRRLHLTQNQQSRHLFWNADTTRRLPLKKPVARAISLSGDTLGQNLDSLTIGPVPIMVE